MDLTIGSCKTCGRLAWVDHESTCKACSLDEEKTSRVFVVQDQHRLDRNTNTWKPIFNLKPAEKFGTLHFLLESHEIPFSDPNMVESLENKLEDFNDTDYLLLIGNPSVIGTTAAIASMVNEGRIQMLQWDGKEKRYIPIFVSLNLN